MIDPRGACTRCGAQMIQEDGVPLFCDACMPEVEHYGKLTAFQAAPDKPPKKKPDAKPR